MTASSPVSRYTDPKALVSRGYQVCNVDIVGMVLGAVNYVA